MKRIIWTILILSLLVTALFFFSRKLTISRIYCNSQYNACSPRINNLVTSFEGKPFFRGKEELGKNLEDDKSILSYSIRFSPPFNLQVFILEKKGEIAIRKDEDEVFTVVTKEGDTVSEASEAELPKIIVKGGPIFPDEMKFAISLIYELSKYYDIKEALISTEGMKTEYKGYTIMLPLEGDIDVIMGSMELVLSWLNTSPEVSTIEGGLSEKIIDFRYRNPIVK